MNNIEVIRLLHPTHLFYHAIGYPKMDKQQKVIEPVLCPMCGIESLEIVDWKIGAKFTDLDLFAEKEKIKFLCPACFCALKHITELHKPYLLTHKTGFNILQFDDVADKAIKLGNKKVVSRFFIKEFLSDPPTDDYWILMFQSEMNKRHTLMKAKVNFGDSETLWVQNGTITYAIPKTNIKELLNALEKIKLSNSLYPYLFIDKEPKDDHKEIHIWKEVAPIIRKHRHAHYLEFLYDRIVPPKEYMKKYYGKLEEEK